MFKGSHDIAHCNIEGCPKKRTCHRYLAHLDALERKDETWTKWLAYIVDVKKPGEDCGSYWEDLNEND